MQIQATGIVDGNFTFFCHALGGAAVNHRRVRRIKLLLGIQHLVYQFICLGNPDIRYRNLPVSLSALTQKHRFFRLQAGRIVHGPLHQLGCCLFA